jgi:PIN domain nuclease of toxin-antitoxin system
MAIARSVAERGRPRARRRRAAAAIQTALWSAPDAPGRDDAILLDTHAWVWTLDGSAGAMCDAAVALVSAAAAARRLYVSDISFWEVSLKVATGKLALSIEPTLWLSRAAAAPGIELLPLTREVLIQSTRLAGTPHGDPADRMLIAHAQLGGMSLLTCDRFIIDYAASQPGVPVCDAR